MRKILLLGSEGQVSWELKRTLSLLGDLTVIGRSTEPSLDLSATEHLEDLVKSFNPDWIINATAYTAVDKAEQEPELAYKINGEAVGRLAELSQQIDAKFVHYSTDYVFDGTSNQPYQEQDITNPQGVYGLSKLQGEKLIQDVGGHHLILRTAWVYGLRGNNFMRTMRRLAREREELRVVSDQFGSPTWSRLIAEATALMLSQLDGNHDAWDQHSGIYHLTSGGVGSWFDFATAIIEHQRQLEHIGCNRITPITSAEYPTPAKRPSWSVLSNQKLEQTFGIKLPDWRDCLAQVQSEIPLYINV